MQRAWLALHLALHPFPPSLQPPPCPHPSLPSPCPARPPRCPSSAPPVPPSLPGAHVYLSREWRRGAGAAVGCACVPGARPGDCGGAGGLAQEGGDEPVREGPVHQLQGDRGPPHHRPPPPEPPAHAVGEDRLRPLGRPRRPGDCPRQVVPAPAPGPRRLPGCDRPGPRWDAPHRTARALHSRPAAHARCVPPPPPFSTGGPPWLGSCRWHCCSSCRRAFPRSPSRPPSTATTSSRRRPRARRIWPVPRFGAAR